MLISVLFFFMLQLGDTHIYRWKQKGWYDTKKWEKFYLDAVDIKTKVNNFVDDEVNLFPRETKGKEDEKQELKRNEDQADESGVC